MKENVSENKQGNDFVFDCIDRLCQRWHKIFSNCDGPYIDSQK